jgi:outer membrane protein assembly factor BamB
MRIFILSLTIIKGFITPVFCQLADSPWPMYQHDAQHTGRSQYKGPEYPVLKWKYIYYPTILSYPEPVINKNGTIYTSGYELKAINLDGSILWSIPIRSFTPPTIGNDGTIYIGSTEKFCYAINPDGTEKWKFKTENTYVHSPSIGSDNTIYCGTGDYYYIPNEPVNLYAINNDGSEKWKYTLDNAYEVSTPLIGKDGELYFGGSFIVSPNFCFYAIKSDGSLQWTYQDSWPLSIATDGTLYFSSKYSTGALYQNGSKKWSINQGAIGDTSIGPERNIYFVSWYFSGVGFLYALNYTGTLTWTFPDQNNSYNFIDKPTIDTDGIIYVCSKSKIYAIKSDGKEKWQYSLNSEINTSPTIGFDGTIYVDTNNGLYAITEGADDTKSPVVHIISPKDNEEVSDSIFVQIEAKDEKVGIESVDIQFDDGQWENCETWSDYYNTNFFWYSMELKDYPDGVNIRLKARATDNSENKNIGYSDEITVIVKKATSTITQTPTLTITTTPTCTLTPTPTATTNDLYVNLKLNPLKGKYVKGDKTNILLDLKTPSYSLSADLYFVMLEQSTNSLYFAINWDNIPQPTISNIILPPDINISDFTLLDLILPCNKPPIRNYGKYYFGIAATKPGTLELLSDNSLSTVELLFSE